MGHTMAIALYRIQDGLIVDLMTYRIALLGLIPGIARPRLTLYLFEVLLSYCRQSLTNDNKTFCKFCVFSQKNNTALFGHLR